MLGKAENNALVTWCTEVVYTEVVCTEMVMYRTGPNPSPIGGIFLTPTAEL